MSIRLKIKLNSVPVEIETEDGVKTYSLVELTGVQRDAYLNHSAARMRFDDKGQTVGIKDFTRLQSFLVHESLRDEKGNKVSEDTIGTWPASVVEVLFAEAQKLSGIGKAEKAVVEEVKKD